MSTAAITPRRVGNTGFATRDFAAQTALSSIPFERKHVSIGMNVLYYNRCNPATEPLVVTVTAVHGADRRRVSVRDPLGIASNHPIMHASDPLTLNEHEKANGCWDYTEEYKERQAESFAIRQAFAKIGAIVTHTRTCVEQLAAKLGETLPAFTGEIPTSEAAGETGRSELSDEEAKRQQAELLAMLDADEVREAAEGAPELATENESIPAGERIAVGGGRRRL